MHGNAQRLRPIEAPALTLPGIAHGFFTREGGVSTGIYRGLNTGIGSKDERRLVLENRARAARHLGTSPENLATPYQVHGDRRCGGRGGMGAGPRPEGRRGGEHEAGHRRGRRRGGLRSGALRRSEGARRRRRACRLEGSASAGVLESTIATMEELGATRPDIVAVLGPTISACRLRGRAGILRPLRRGGRKKRPLLPRFRARRAFDVRPPRLHRRAAAGSGRRQRHVRWPLHLCRRSSASIPIAAPPIGANPTMAGSSPRSC